MGQFVKENARQKESKEAREAYEREWKRIFGKKEETKETDETGTHEQSARATEGFGKQE